MNEVYVQIAASIGAALLAAIAIFQILLLAGAPLGEYSWGGKHTGVLPPPQRWMSLPAAIILCLMGFVLLIHTNVLSVDAFTSTRGFVWGITIFLGLNTLGNAASKSRKEKVVMTPVSGLCFLMSLTVLIFG
ncbi:hypothetical protein [Paenibacillus silvisoli]|uniref:hypothetical protein n=1 Tax=Paenibacillus silvisoli TaxID=3110539 RepID=UPI0028051742|nr:hypothetical protein [Paenibacillus silvisoli]